MRRVNPARSVNADAGVGAEGHCVLGVGFFQAGDMGVQFVFVDLAGEVEADHFVRAQRRLAPGPAPSRACAAVRATPAPA